MIVIRVPRIVEDHTEKHKKLLQKLEAFETYIRSNSAALIPNYGLAVWRCHIHRFCRIDHQPSREQADG
ncbi:hypothetical protein DESC_790057 [Desulfosarcina cetonica]|nr:hypothetical protein DESC_790057 [Desulfosarcina cetonica]